MVVGMHCAWTVARRTGYSGSSRQVNPPTMGSSMGIARRPPTYDHQSTERQECGPTAHLIDCHSCGDGRFERGVPVCHVDVGGGSSGEP